MNGVSLYDTILQELQSRGCAHSEMFPPYYVCSMGCHLFNRVNKAKQLYFEAGRLVDTRMHILFVAPSGFSKSFWLDQFLRGVGSVVGNAIPTTYESSMTEAGWTGTIRSQNGTPFRSLGCAEVNKLSIVGIEEFSALTAMMHAEYSKALDTALLTSLDTGFVQKRLAAGKIEYETQVTLWAGVQPARFDLASGLGRRFMFLQFIPSAYDRRDLKSRRRLSRNVRYNPLRTESVHGRLRTLQETLQKVETVEYDRDLYYLFDRLDLTHYEEPLFEKLLLGYTIMQEKFTPPLVLVELDAQAQSLCTRAAKWRIEVGRGAEYSEVIQVLKDHNGQMTLRDLKDALLTFGKNWEQSQEVIMALQRSRAIRISQDVVKLVG